MVWKQHTVHLPSFRRGCHLVTDYIEREIGGSLKAINVGLCHIFIQHTSASLTINEVGRGASVARRLARTSRVWLPGSAGCPRRAKLTRAMPPCFNLHINAGSMPDASPVAVQNADPDVRADMETFLNHVVPEGRGAPWIHTCEGEWVSAQVGASARPNRQGLGALCVSVPGEDCPPCPETLRQAGTNVWPRAAAYAGPDDMPGERACGCLAQEAGGACCAGCSGAVPAH